MGIVGRYVPVQDQETPRCERDAAVLEEEKKHRKFHDLHSVARGEISDRAAASANRDEVAQQVTRILALRRSKQAA